MASSRASPAGLVLDTSAIVAIILGERHSERMIEYVSRATVIAAGAPTLVETGMVLSSRLKRDAGPLLLAFLREADLEVIPFAKEHYETALDAFHRYGKGRHPAALNFGDCLTYSVARLAQLPLLCVGNDFPKTDLATLR